MTATMVTLKGSEARIGDESLGGGTQPSAAASSVARCSSAPLWRRRTLRAIDGSRTWLVLRDDATVEADRSVFFTSDRVAVKATMRAGFGFAHRASVVKITTV